MQKHFLISSLRLLAAGMLLLLSASSAIAHSTILEQGVVPIPSSSIPVTYVNAFSLSIGGMAFPSGTTYERLPPEAEGQVTPGVWQWSRTSSGMYVQFISDASSIHLNYTLLNNNYTQFSNFPPNGFSGCDLYRFDNVSATWRWIATTFNGLGAASHGGVVLESPLFADSEGWPVGPAPSTPTLPATYQYRLNLPSYNGVTSVAIGVPVGATIAADDSWNISKPITYVGTSITQGGLTGRPGQTYVHRLQRKLNMPFNNMGFCGSCILDTGLGTYMSMVESSLFVVDCGWNQSPFLIKNNTALFILQLRAAQPNVPIVLVEPSDYRPTWILGDTFNNTGRRVELAAAYTSLVNAGVTGIHYVDGESLFTGISMYDDPTFEGVHPLDYGHKLVADALAPVIGGILGLPGYPLRTMEQSIAIAQATLQTLTPTLAKQEEESTRSSSSRVMPTTTIPLGLSSIDTPPSAFTATVSSSAQEVVWTPATSLTILGRAFNNTPTPFNRLPSEAEGHVRSAVWDLSLNSAGLMVSFTTNSSSLSVNFQSSGDFWPMVHFPVSGVYGMEIFGFDDANSVWRHVQPLQLDYGVNTYNNVVASGFLPTTPSPGLPRQYILYFPTYSEPVSLDIGIDTGASIAPNNPFVAATAGPIVWYGTSILQGGVSFKSSQIFTSIISRALNVEIFNFGFSGNGEMEINVTQYLTTITPTPSMFIIDCNRNMDAALVTANAIPLVKYLRQLHPTTPILFAEGTAMGIEWLVPDQAAFAQEEDAALLAAYNTLVQGGDKNMYYAPYTDLFSSESLLESPCNRGLHPTDQGMRDVAAYYIKTIPSILAKSRV